MPSWTSESPAPVNVEKYTTLCENVSQSDIQTFIYSFPNVSLIFICDKWTESTIRLDSKDDAIWSWCMTEYEMDGRPAQYCDVHADASISVFAPTKGHVSSARLVFADGSQFNWYVTNFFSNCFSYYIFSILYDNDNTNIFYFDSELFKVN